MRNFIRVQLNVSFSLSFPSNFGKHHPEKLNYVKRPDLSEIG